ncbi:HAD hydrolase-like protein [Streptomyces sp. SL13]|uniref:HAD hydrolase-like protein n=1 Tax=Streptantibioticus silvisoli TaxID=2705255 RepID=A0AA90HA93_9ACTN|nr:HAD family hydrolase [Streptantibioticus silvisoli]MDI5971855.1 HAD hydrolase-like protein [Streptantibioticus silvisoli]
MTATREELAAIMAPVKHVLLDFDGPVCSVFAGLPAAEVARRMAEELTGPEGPPPGHDLTDPFAMLLRIAEERPELVPAADDALARLEVEAVASARPTDGALEFLEACAATGRRVSIVSNNATVAIEHYVEAHGFGRLVSGMTGRVRCRPESMKPSPELLRATLRRMRADPGDGIFIGDAVRDVEAAKAAGGIEAIGFANKAGKAELLANAGAVAVVSAMASLAYAQGESC